MMNTRPLVECLVNSDQKVKQFCVIPRLASSHLVYNSSIQCPKRMCLVLQRDSRFASGKLSRNRHCTDWTAWLEWLLYHLQWLIWFIVKRQTKHYSNAVYYFSDPTDVGCFFTISLPPSADSAKINSISTNSKQDAARRLEATQGKHGFLCYIFRLWVIIKALLKQISLHLL